MPKGRALRIGFAGAFLVSAVASGLMAASAGLAGGGSQSPRAPESFLFTVQAVGGTTAPLPKQGKVDERFSLTLTGVSPVTQFSDRPFRDSTIISPAALVRNWNAWFAGDPPNAVLTFARPGRAPGSFVISLTRPRYDARDRTLSFTAVRENRQHDPVDSGSGWRRTATPTTFTDASLFIDNATVTPVPSLTDVTPSNGSTSGGAAVVLTGTNLNGATSVKFGGYPASFTVNSSTQITAVTPASAPGLVNVSVTTPYGTGTATNAFTFGAPPVVMSVSPKSGSTAGGTSVTIVGSNFSGATSVSFGGVPALSYTVDSSTLITAVTPPGRTGSVNVSVASRYGMGTLASAFTYS